MYLLFLFIMYYYLVIPFLPFSFSLFQNKDTTDSRSRGANNSSSRGGRGGAERYVGRGSSIQLSSNGMWPLRCILGIYVIV